MKNGPLVTVVVPVYNARMYLEACVDSIRAQTYTNLEIILVDDGSTDGSGELCDGLAREDPRIQVIHRANGGVSSARNAGLDAARGEYVCFVDSDDRILETMAEEMTAVMEAEACGLCVGGILVRDEENEANSYCICYPKPALFQFSARREKDRFLCRWILNSRFGWSGCTQMFRREIIERHHLRFLDGQKMYEDIDFFFRYTACCQSLRYIPKVFYIYRQHAGSAVHTCATEEKVFWLLRMTRLWDCSIEGQGSLPPAYICAGIAYSACGLVNKNLWVKAEREQVVQAFQLFREAENGTWLLEQARLALKNRVEILQICGLGLGLFVCGFYKSVLTGKMSAFQLGKLAKDVLQNSLQIETDIGAVFS